MHLGLASMWWHYVFLKCLLWYSGQRLLRLYILSRLNRTEPSRIRRPECYIIASNQRNWSLAAHVQQCHTPQTFETLDHNYMSISIKPHAESAPEIHDLYNAFGRNRNIDSLRLLIHVSNYGYVIIFSCKMFFNIY